MHIHYLCHVRSRFQFFTRNLHDCMLAALVQSCIIICTYIHTIVQSCIIICTYRRLKRNVIIHNIAVIYFPLLNSMYIDFNSRTYICMPHPPINLSSYLSVERREIFGRHSHQVVRRRDTPTTPVKPACPVPGTTSPW